MPLRASEFYEAGMALPPSVRKDVALRLLDSIEAADQGSVDAAWNTKISSRVETILNGKMQTIPGEQVLAELAEHRGAPARRLREAGAASRPSRRTALPGAGTS